MFGFAYVLYVLVRRFSRVIGQYGILFLECFGFTTAVFWASSDRLIYLQENTSYAVSLDYDLLG